MARKSKKTATAQIAPHGPFYLEMKVAMTDGEGMEASVAYDFPPGLMPDASDFKYAFDQIAASPLVVEHSLRLMDRHEFLEADLRDRTGMNFAVPGPSTWDTPPDLLGALKGMVDAYWRGSEDSDDDHAPAMVKAALAAIAKASA